MIFGYYFSNKTYSKLQIFSVIIVTVGVISATLSRPSSSQTDTSVGDYFFGLSLLFLATALTGLQGLLQDRTYKAYGPNAWREGIFYTVRRSLDSLQSFN